MSRIQRTTRLFVVLVAFLSISRTESFSSLARHSSRLPLLKKEGSALPHPLSAPQRSQQQQQHSAIESPLFRAPPLLLHARPNSDDSTQESDDDNQKPPPSFSRADALVAETSLGLKRASWFSWWCQMILTVTSAVILVFAKNVLKGSREAQVNFLFGGTGIVVSFMSIFWTWGGGARLSRRLLRRPTTRIKTANMLRRAIRVGVSLNLIGMLLTLLGSEQTVGVLAIKVLTARPWNSAGGMPMMAATLDGLQPLDILVVQANTNLLFSHFCSLVSLLYLTGFVSKLDPPSVEDGAVRQQ